MISGKKNLLPHNPGECLKLSFFTVFSNTTDRSLNTIIGSSRSNSTWCFIRQKGKFYREKPQNNYVEASAESSTPKMYTFTGL